MNDLDKIMAVCADCFATGRLTSESNLQNQAGLASSMTAPLWLHLVSIPEHAVASSSCLPVAAGIAPPPLPPVTPTHAGCPPVLASELPAGPASPRLQQTAPSQPAAAQPGWLSPLRAATKTGSREPSMRFMKALLQSTTMDEAALWFKHLGWRSSSTSLPEVLLQVLLDLWPVT